MPARGGKVLSVIVTFGLLLLLKGERLDGSRISDGGDESSGVEVCRGPSADGLCWKSRESMVKRPGSQTSNSMSMILSVIVF